MWFDNWNDENEENDEYDAYNECDETRANSATHKANVSLPAPYFGNFT
jgi:hypothetical protein